jgi:hypothetical protein
MITLLEKAKDTVIKYYQHVDIKKAGGFTDKVEKNGSVKGVDINYAISEEASSIQIEIIKNNNELIKSGELSQFNSWLQKFERNLKY